MPRFHFYYLLIIVSCCLVSCVKNRKGDEELKNAIKQTLENSTKAINQSTLTLLKDLEDKTTDVCSRERGLVWYEKAGAVSRKTKNILAYVERLKESGDILRDSSDILFDQLRKYKSEIFEIDSSIGTAFLNNPYANIETDFDSITKNDFYEIYFKNINNSSISLIKLLNDIKIIENKIVDFCNVHVGCIIDFFDSYSVIVGQNSSILKSGDYLEIKAGVGAFSKTATRPKILFNGKVSELGEEGYAFYRMKTTLKPGNYKIPVVINFLNPTTGKNETQQIFVEYTIAENCK